MSDLYKNRKLRNLDVPLRFTRAFWTRAVAIYDECRDGETGYSDARRLFQKWLEDETGIFTYYPTDWCIAVENAIQDGTLGRKEFARALYGVTLLAINNRWYSEVNDCPDKWYEERNPLALDPEDEEEEFVAPIEIDDPLALDPEDI